MDREVINRWQVHFEVNSTYPSSEEKIYGFLGDCIRIDSVMLDVENHRFGILQVDGSFERQIIESLRAKEFENSIIKVLIDKSLR